MEHKSPGINIGAGTQKGGKDACDPVFNFFILLARPSIVPGKLAFHAFVSFVFYKSFNSGLRRRDGSWLGLAC